MKKAKIILLTILFISGLGGSFAYKIQDNHQLLTLYITRDYAGRAYLVWEAACTSILTATEYYVTTIYGQQALIIKHVTHCEE